MAMASKTSPLPTTYLTNNVSILLGDGTGNFSASTNFVAGDGPLLSSGGRFQWRRQARPRRCQLWLLSSSVSILLGDGAGNFSAPTNFAAGDNPLSVAVGDFNGDGKQDLAVANQLRQRVDLVGRWRRQFQRSHKLSRWRFPVSVAVGDFNGDGKQDLAVANGGSDNVSILLGDGTGSFSAATNFAGGDYPT